MVKQFGGLEIQTAGRGPQVHQIFHSYPFYNERLTWINLFGQASRSSDMPNHLFYNWYFDWISLITVFMMCVV